MVFSISRVDPSAGPFRRALQYALYDWSRDMPWAGRLLTVVALLSQVGALVAALLGPRQTPFQLLVLFLYLVGLCLMNGTLTSEFVRKTQLEADQLAAEQIQQTLQPQSKELPGYQLETFYKPLRGVGGDYFDIVELADGRTLFAIADVSGKGTPAALLAANIQALVRSFSNIVPNPLSLATHVNNHLCRYTPPDRFATAVFALLSHETGELTYVNAGQDPPILSSSSHTSFLEATGMPLGLVPDTPFECRRAVIPPGGRLLFFTDGLTDGIGGEKPEERVCEAIATNSEAPMSKLKALLNPEFNHDDITILLLMRLAGQAEGEKSSA